MPDSRVTGANATKLAAESVVGIAGMGTWLRMGGRQGQQVRERRAGANHVVNPNVSGGVTMAAMLVRPSAITLLEIGNRFPELNLRTDQVALSARAAARKTLDATHIRESIVVVALLRGADQKQITFNPKGSTTLKVGDELVVMGTPRQLQQLGRWT